MQANSASATDLFKGIALFTPGGGVVYCIDPLKQNRWHLHLCALIQELLGLSEPPHFLVPCYTATLDRWIDPRTRQVHTTAEAALLVLRHQALLNAIFGTPGLVWRGSVVQEGLCDPIVLATYRQQFPQLWEPQDLIVRYEKADPALSPYPASSQDLTTTTSVSPESQGYVLRLFVSGSSIATERTLQNLHRLLDQALSQPYTLKVIDVSQNPEQAEADQVSATPTLVKAWPLPVRRIVGNLDNIDQLLRILGSKRD